MNKINLLLHIGIHKTGSTAIQSFLYLNHDEILKHGYYYPIDHTLVENKLIIIRKLIQTNSISQLNVLLENLVKRAKENNCHTVILSDEDYQEFCHSSDDRIKCLSNYFNVKILMYVRRQDRYSESAYGFWIQWHYKRITAESRSIFHIFPLVNYVYLVSFWETIFSRENIYLKVYDDESKNHNLINNFIKFLEIDLQDIKTPDITESNITSNKFILDFLRKINHIPFSDEEYIKIKEYLLTKSIIKNGPKPFFLDVNERKRVLNLASDTNKEIAKKYFGRKELFTYENLEDKSPTLSNEIFNQVFDDLVNEPNLSTFINRSLLNLNIEKLRDLIIENKREKNISLCDYIARYKR